MKCKLFNSFNLDYLDSRTNFLKTEFGAENLYKLNIFELEEEQLVELIQFQNISKLSIKDPLKEFIFFWCFLCNYTNAISLILNDVELAEKGLRRSFLISPNYKTLLFEKFCIENNGAISKADFEGASILKGKFFNENFLLSITGIYVDIFRRLIVDCGYEFIWNYINQYQFSWTSLQRKLRSVHETNLNQLVFLMQKTELDTSFKIGTVCIRCTLETVLILENYGLDFKKYFNGPGPDLDKITYPLFSVLKKCNLELAEYLLKNEADINYIDSNDTNIFQIICRDICFRYHDEREFRRQVDFIFNNGFTLDMNDGLICLLACDNAQCFQYIKAKNYFNGTVNLNRIFVGFLEQSNDYLYETFDSENYLQYLFKIIKSFIDSDIDFKQVDDDDKCTILSIIDEFDEYIAEYLSDLGSELSFNSLVPMF